MSFIAINDRCLLPTPCLPDFPCSPFRPPPYLTCGPGGRCQGTRPGTLTPSHSGGRDWQHRSHGLRKKGSCVNYPLLMRLPLKQTEGGNKAVPRGSRPAAFLSFFSKTDLRERGTRTCRSTYLYRPRSAHVLWGWNHDLGVSGATLRPAEPPGQGEARCEN